MNVGDKLTVNLRCGKPTSDKAENLIRAWPMDEKERNAMTAANVVEIQFNGKKSVFTPGTEISGEAVVTHIEDAKAFDETGVLQPRFKLDKDGLPVTEGGKDVILKRISIRFTKGSYKRAASADEVLTAAA